MRYWYPAANLSIPGPLWRTGYLDGDRNAMRGAILHSAEGYLAGVRQLVRDGPQTWPFTIDLDGTVYQHYAIDAACYMGGNEWVNENLIGVEFLGRKGEPLTNAQIAAGVTLIRWLADECDFPIVRGRTDGAELLGLYEHRDVATLRTPNAGPTPCPNGRIPWEWFTREAEIMPASVTAVRVVNSEAIEAIKRSIGGMQQDPSGRSYIATAGPGHLELDIPEGFEAIVSVTAKP